jgi:predicted dehydrogenase
MDYLQRKPKRKIRIVGSKAELVCDFIEKWMKINSLDHKICLTEEDFFKIEDTYMAELQNFIETCKSSKEPEISIYDGIKALELLEDSHDRQA